MKWGQKYDSWNNPCHDCPKKGCGAYHSTCKVYGDWKARREEIRAKKNRHLDIAYALNDLGEHRVSTRKR